MKKILVFIFAVFSFFISHSQGKVPVRFGKVSVEDFSPKAYSVDSNASAVIIADVGSSEIVGNSKGWFSLQFKHYRRIRILNKNGFDLANMSIPLYSEGDDEEKLDALKAVTYNLENGQVVETKLGKDDVFKEKINKNLVRKKFTLPNIREGSILEFEYTVISDYMQFLRAWEFQGSYPRLWSEYNVTLPSFFSYVFLKQGYLDAEETRNESRENFNITELRGAEASERVSFTASVTDYRWIVKNAPPLKEEKFTSTLDNHIQKIEFELTAQYDPLPPHVYMSTWPKLSEDLLKAEWFGEQLAKDNNWLSDIVKVAVAGSSSRLEQAKKIYAYVRDNFTCTDYSALSLDQTLKNVLKTRKGTVAEINLLLTAMLKYENIEADPVILSTKSNGYTFALYPILSRFNYVICDANIDGTSYFLDASYPRLGFGRLTPSCYNGHARKVDVPATAIELSADSLTEKKITSIMMNMDENGNMEGRLQQVPGYYESHDIRETVKEKGRDEFFKEVKKAYGQDAELAAEAIDSLNNLEENVAIHYQFKLKQDKDDVIYLNPMWGEGYKENPFKSAERFYPVEMPYAMDETYLFTLIVPDGYVVDELPKSTIVKLNEEGDGQFEYRVSESAGMISLRSRIILKRAYYLPEEYELLREFFNLIVKKHNEQIVLKKKK